MKQGLRSIPGLKTVAKDDSITIYYISYLMIGQIAKENDDRSVIPYLYEHIDDEAEQGHIRQHVIWGLNFFVNLGGYSTDTPDNEKIEIYKKYKKWWKEHKKEFST